MSITYYSKTDPALTVEAIVYLRGGVNYDLVRHFLERHARSETTHESVRFTEMGGPDYRTIVFYPTSGNTIYIMPGNVAYVRHDGSFGTASYDGFHEIFTDERPKESAVPEPTETPEPSEYETNLTTVYDALAILRAYPREQDFEFAAKEIMELLSSAFDEGWLDGFKSAQRNPYNP